MKVGNLSNCKYNFKYVIESEIINWVFFLFVCVSVQICNLQVRNAGVGENSNFERREKKTRKIIVKIKHYKF